MSAWARDSLRLRQVLHGEHWQTALQALPGYTGADSAGEVLSLVRALPWWNYRSAKAQRPEPAPVAGAST